MFLHQSDYVTWGLSTLYWEDQIDWRFKTAKVGSFLVPDGTKASTEHFDLCALREKAKVHELFRYVSDETMAEKSTANGWNVPLLKKILSDSARQTDHIDSEQIGEFSSWQVKIKDNDLAYSYSNYGDVPISHIFVREYDGKISHFILYEDAKYYTGESAGDGDYLYKSIGKFDNWDQAMILFTAGVGQGTLHSIRGLGPKIYAACQVSDRMKNQLTDGAMQAASIMLQPDNEAQAEKIRVARFGGFSVVKGGKIISDKTFSPNLQGLVGVESLIQANLQKNVGAYRPDVNENENTPQAQNMMEVRNRASKEAKLEKSDIHLYFVAWDRLYREILRRVLNPSLTDVDPGYEAVKEFKDACIAAGVPRELLKTKHLRIKAHRTIGNGSTLMRSLITADLLSVSPYFSEQGKERVLKDYVTVRGGPEAANRYLPDPNPDMIPSTQHSIAALENNDMAEGTDVLVGVDQPHVIHLMVHMAALTEDAQAFIEEKYQGQPEQLLAFMQISIQHCSQHLDFIASDPARENEYQQFSSQLQELAQIMKHVEGIVNERQRAAEEQQQAQQMAAMQAAEEAQAVDTERALAEQKLQADFEFKMAKEANEQIIREKKLAHEIEMDQRRMAAQERAANDGSE